ncbi:hypothetical protein ILUMI_19425, partial [Ignelater luminosus]
MNYQLAQDLIVAKMDEGPINHTLTFDTAHDMWQKLLTVYDKKSEVSVHMVQQKCFNYKYEGQGLAAHVSSLEDIRNQLKQLGEDMSDHMLIYYKCHSCGRFGHVKRYCRQITSMGGLEDVINEKEVITEVDEAEIKENKDREEKEEKNRAGGRDESVASYDLRDRSPEAPLICGFVDTNWAGDTRGRKSTSGFTFKVMGNCVTWFSKKPDSVSLRSAESEFVALSLACSEACWVRNIVNDLQVVTVSKIELYEDNQAVIKASKNPEYHSKMKHIDICYHF